VWNDPKSRLETLVLVVNHRLSFIYLSSIHLHSSTSIKHQASITVIPTTNATTIPLAGTTSMTRESEVVYNYVEEVDPNLVR